MKTYRWGIASCGKISSDFTNAILHDGQPISAVAARSVDSAKNFAEKFGIKKFYGNYDDLCTDKDVDVIYVGSINSTHLAIVTKYLQAGKPVLCEKPLCLNVAQTKTLLDLSKKHNTFLMEAMWARFFPAYQEMRRRLDNKDLGDITHAHVSFGVPIAEVARVNQKELGGGSVLDIGIYAINFLTYVMGGCQPVEIQAMGDTNSQGVEGDVCATFRYSDGRYGTFQLSTRAMLANNATVTGTKGFIELDSPFWCPLGFRSTAGEFKAPLDPDADRKYNYDNSQGLKFQSREVLKCLEEGRIESTVMPHSQTLVLAELMQAVREKVGAVAY